ncbi:monocarboxylate transporter 6-like [Vanessa cardui]|uniref:monocarboxylate transporter 6-like n=1 Tax=Vanessa cardui TaxID=171605 RepID=UPI001F1324FA|nr:monocarboxylate transporter 6-like [Vanessa cardui]
MPPKPILVKNENRKSIILTPSRIVSRPDNLEGGEETEIAAQILVPQEGGWGWVVVAASFLSVFILDGITFTFGSLIKDMSNDFDISDSLIAFVNSLAIAIYFIAGPMASAFINRFGFRSCIMSGSVLSSLSLFISYFSTNYPSLCLFYGCFAGFGYCLINMAAGLVVGFYFEKLRSLALAIATCGSSIGIMVFFPLNTYLVKIAGWRTVTLLHSGLLGITYFLGMTFQPLLSFTVAKTTEDPTRTVTYLPNLSTAAVRPTASRTKAEGLVPTATERLFCAVSNLNFPTAAAVVDDNKFTSDTQPGPSTGAVSKLTLTANAPQGGISPRQLKQFQSIMSRTSIQDKKTIEITVSVEPPKKTGCCGRLCNWDQHVPQSRPMYRDDVFYDGKLDKLPVYQKSKMTTQTSKTGLEYQLAVSRAATAIDLRERRGVFTTAARRVLATMMDPKLLKKKSFLCLCFAGMLIYVGFLVPYVYIQEKNIQVGIDPQHCSLFVSVIGFSNAAGRLILGAVACYFDPLYVYVFAMLISGISTMASNLSFSLYYQYLYCFIFGFFVSSVASLRSMVLVTLYGLDNLTNATGVVLLFQGIGSLVSTPVAGILKNLYGFSVSFYIAGIFITIGGLILLPVKGMSIREQKGSIPVGQTRN